MVASVVVTLLAGFGLERLVPASDWIASGRRSVPALAGLALVMLAAILAQEGSNVAAVGGPDMELWAKLTVIGALAGLVAACLVFAVVPRLDPLGLSDEQRKLYVYAAEALVLLVFFHLRWTMPFLFRGLLQQYWMLVVMGLAFLGAGVSELFHRRGMPVLSEPLARTAACLPFIPAAFFWLLPNPSVIWSLAHASPAVWFLMGLFYGILAITKRNVWPAVGAVLAMNIGLWVLWYRLDWGFWEHPQLWLIPIALCLLVAEYLNRDRLSENASTGIRYVSLGAVYISSSVEYLRAIGDSVWLPLVLILLSLAGVFVGVLMRIRSFLYMGVTFLLLVIVTMINHARLENTWVLWVCCILLGALTIAAVGMYEKHREDVRAAIKRFRGWQR